MRCLGVMPETLKRLTGLKPDELGRFLESDCGCEGWTIDKERRRVLALRFRDGHAFTHRTYDIEDLKVRAHGHAKRANR